MLRMIAELLRSSDSASQNASSLRSEQRFAKQIVTCCKTDALPAELTPHIIYKTKTACILEFLDTDG